MFARIVCALLGFHVLKFLAKYKTQEPGGIIMELTTCVHHNELVGEIRYHSRIY